MYKTQNTTDNTWQTKLLMCQTKLNKVKQFTEYEEEDCFQRHFRLKLELKYTKGLSWSTTEVEFVLQQKVEVEVQQRTTCGSDNDAASPFNLSPLLLTVSSDVLLSILLTAVLYFHISSCYLLFVVFAICPGVIKARVI